MCEVKDKKERESGDIHFMRVIPLYKREDEISLCIVDGKAEVNDGGK